MNATGGAGVAKIPISKNKNRLPAEADLTAAMLGSRGNHVKGKIPLQEFTQ